MEIYTDGEVVGIDTDGNLILWDGERKERYNCGETYLTFGINNLTEEEKKRVLPACLI